MSDATYRRGYKFYSEKWAIEALKKRRLKISTLDDLNDPFEFLGVRLPSGKHRKDWEKMKKQLFRQNGIICFSKSWRNPVIWSHYADNHRGIALGFDVPIENAIDVNYRRTRAPFPNLSKAPSTALVPLLQRILATKFKHWEYEDEFRVYVKADTICKDTGLYFFDYDQEFELKEIVLGPLTTTTSNELREIAADSSVKIITSRLAFNGYKVTRQMNRKYQK